MTLRIGGEFEIDPGMLAIPETGGQPTLPKPHVERLSTGRSALHAALQDIVARGGAREAWLPAYICSSVVAAFANMNFALHFYHIGQDLATQGFPEDPTENAVFLYAHYFGKNNAAAGKWVDQARRAQPLFVIEDCVQASLNADIGANGDYVVTSYRKFLPQPDGAYLGTDHPLEIDLHESDERFISSRTVGKLLRHRITNEELYLELLADSESRLDATFGAYRMSWLSEFMMKRADISAVARARRDNWQKLSALIAGGTAGSVVVPVYGALDPGEVPLGFPVRVACGKRDALRRYLMERQIFCPVHWNLPHLQNNDIWKEELELSQTILTLPVDQRMGEEHLRYMVQAIESFGVEVK